MRAIYHRMRKSISVLADRISRSHLPKEQGARGLQRGQFGFLPGINYPRGRQQYNHAILLSPLEGIIASSKSVSVKHLLEMRRHWCFLLEMRPTLDNREHTLGAWVMIGLG